MSSPWLLLLVVSCCLVAWSKADEDIITPYTTTANTLTNFTLRNNDPGQVFFFTIDDKCTRDASSTLLTLSPERKISFTFSTPSVYHVCYVDNETLDDYNIHKVNVVADLASVVQVTPPYVCHSDLVTHPLLLTVYGPSFNVSGAQPGEYVHLGLDGSCVGAYFMAGRQFPDYTPSIDMRPGQTYQACYSPATQVDDLVFLPNNSVFHTFTDVSTGMIFSFDNTDSINSTLALLASMDRTPYGDVQVTIQAFISISRNDTYGFTVETNAVIAPTVLVRGYDISHVEYLPFNPGMKPLAIHITVPQGHEVPYLKVFMCTDPPANQTTSDPSTTTSELLTSTTTSNLSTSASTTTADSSLSTSSSTSGTTTDEPVSTSSDATTTSSTSDEAFSSTSGVSSSSSSSSDSTTTASIGPPPSRDVLNVIRRVVRPSRAVICTGVPVDSLLYVPDDQAIFVLQEAARVTVSLLSPALVRLNVTSNTTCANTLDASWNITAPTAPRASVDVVSSISSVSYAWSDGNQTWTAPQINDLPPGQYTLQVKDQYQCGLFYNFSIGQQVAPVVNVMSVVHEECNAPSSGMAMANASVPSTFVWSDGAQVIRSDPNTMLSNVSGLAPGRYAVVALDAVTQCPSAVQYVQLAAAPSMNYSMVYRTDCQQGDTTLQLAIQTAFPSSMLYPLAPNFNVKWYKDGVTQPIQSDYIAGFLVNNDTAAEGRTAMRVNASGGSFFFTIADSVHSCYIPSANLSLPMYTPMAFSSFVATSVRCGNGSDGSIEATVAGGAPPYTISFNNTTYPSTNLTTRFSGLSGALYSMSVQDSRGCTLNQSSLISQPDPINVRVASIRPETRGRSDGNALLDVSGGRPPFVYTWWLANNSSAFNSTGRNMTYLIAGQYSVIVQDSSFCQVFVSVVVPSKGSPWSGVPTYVADHAVAVTVSATIIALVFFLACAVGVFWYTKHRARKNGPVMLEPMNSNGSYRQQSADNAAVLSGGSDDDMYTNLPVSPKSN
eukprot:TRINITY_DN2635_c0_g1_i2.p1 TRINITY_DN2635_c0_g1~~TRINITY_DN2635_c0_g1_i2.p1  ORF type:complete len:1011 (-),score=187.12 TRINITY_DN2635_c0_g1_i2:14-3019(-)